MNVQTLIYSYLAVCISMIVFNCICIVVFRSREHKVEGRSLALRKRVEEQIDRIMNSKAVEDEHKRYLQKVLRRTGNLPAFDEALEPLVEKYRDTMEKYFLDIHSVFTTLTFEFSRNDTITVAYFAYIIGKYKILKGMPAGPVMNEMMLLLRRESLYCRENALYAIYSSGDCKNVVKALFLVDNCKCFHHPKLLSDRLLAFDGDHNELAYKLWRSFDQFSAKMKIVILDYIRFSNVDMRDGILKLMSDQNQDDEIRFSCIRYFGRHYYEKAYPLLIEFVEDTEKYRWEYGAIAAMSLSTYPGRRTVDVLKRSLYNPNWYVRFNASLSLQEFKLHYTDLIDILDSDDRYAREILQYRIEHTGTKGDLKT